jgi:hypothetical protein
MRGTLEIDKTSGAITESKLSQVEEGASISELSQEKIQHIGLLLTSILQDVATYMRQKNLNTLEHMTLKLDSHHIVNIFVGTQVIKAIVQEIQG